MLQSVQTIFLSIVFESLPFILLGVLISSLIQELISQEAIMRLLPKNRILAVIVSSLLGLILPVCDCGTIPVARSLIGKGVSVSAAMTFTLAAPVVNPLTMIATYVAFGMNTTMMIARTGTTLTVAVIVGWVLLYLEPKRSIKVDHFFQELQMLEMAATRSPKRSFGQILNAVVGHTILEFFEVGGFVVMSAGVAAILQTAMPTTIIEKFAHHSVWSVIAMMVLAMLLSLCSEADAFVARSLAGISTTGGILSFLVIGQMVDLRNALLLPRVFPRKVVVSTYVLSILLTLYAGICVNIS